MKSRGGLIWSGLGWIVGIGMFFPVLWMVLTSFKHERDAFTETPKLIFKPTLEQYKAVFDGGIGTALLNSAWATIGSTLLVLVLAIPCAYALAIPPGEKGGDVLFFFLSPRLLPVGGRA